MKVTNSIVVAYNDDDMRVMKIMKIMIMRGYDVIVDDDDEL